MTTTTTTQLAENCGEIDARTLFAQMGAGNYFAVAGGRAKREVGGAIVFPQRYGWEVRVTVNALDMYCVERVFSRGGKRTVKGVMDDIHCEDVGNVIYDASCYHHPWGR